MGLSYQTSSIISLKKSQITAYINSQLLWQCMEQKIPCPGQKISQVYVHTHPIIQHCQNLQMTGNMLIKVTKGIPLRRNVQNNWFHEVSESYNVILNYSDKHGSYGRIFTATYDQINNLKVFKVEYCGMSYYLTYLQDQFNTIKESGDTISEKFKKKSPQGITLKRIPKPLKCGPMKIGTLSPVKKNPSWEINPNKKLSKSNRITMFLVIPKPKNKGIYKVNMLYIYQ